METSTAAITDTRTYLTFSLAEEVFAVEVANVKEVLDLETVTKVPRTPHFMRGVINLRGRVVPVVDMRIKFGMPQAVDTIDTCIVVMEVDVEGEMTVIGALADSVREVFALNPDQIEPPPSIGTKLNTDFIKGMGKQGEHFIIVLDIDKVFSADELTLVTDAGQAVEPASVAEAADEEGIGSPEDLKAGPDDGSVKKTRKKGTTKRSKKSAKEPVEPEQVEEVHPTSAQSGSCQGLMPIRR